jgi:hypothetical protein
VSNATLRLHRELYVEKAIDDAIALYAAHATIAKADDGAYVTVSVASDRPGRADRVARELGNYALGLTIPLRTAPATGEAP